MAPAAVPEATLTAASEITTGALSFTSVTVSVTASVLCAPAPPLADTLKL